MGDYLALRRQLKQSIRAQLQRDSGSGATNSIGDSHAHNNYGSFFGRSETVFTDTAAKEISNLCLKLKVGSGSKKSSAAAMRKEKVQRFKETRDYSFLSSSFEGEICSAPPPITRDAKRGLITNSKAVKGGFKRGETTKNPRKLMEKGGAADQKSNSSRAKKESRSSTVTKQESKKSASKQSDEQKKKAKSVEKREREEANYASIIIRELFGYDPTRFSDDEEEDLNMETSFADIQKEERRSAKIASNEDRRELAKLEAAECRKKRKLKNS